MMRRSLLLLLACGMAGSLAAQTIYVAPYGNDLALGTIGAPLKSLEAALSRTGTEIRMAQGDYPVATTNTLTLATGRRIIGGLDGSGFRPDARTPTRILFPTNFEAGLLAQGSARLESLTFKGGFYSVRASGSGSVYNCTFEGSSASALRFEGSGSPTADLLTFTGGSNGVEVADSSSATIRNCQFSSLNGRALYARNSAVVTFQNGAIENLRSDGILFTGTATGLVENTIIRRCSGDGVILAGTSPTLRGCLVALNENGFTVQSPSTATITNCTIVKNRQSGVRIIRSFPSLLQNILSHNVRFGVSEDTGDAGGTVNENLFYQNTLGAYIDSATTISTTLSQLNGQLHNTTPGAGNLIGDPQYISIPSDFFDLQPTSAAVDALTRHDSGFLLDINGNTRLHDFEGFGGSGNAALDAGAYEYQDGLEWGFNTLVSDWTPLPAPAPIFNGGIITKKPGRWRFQATQGNTFAYANQSIEGGLQPADKVAVAHFRVSSPTGDKSVESDFRLRFNAVSNRLSSMIDINTRATLTMAPAVPARDYLVVSDFRQAGSVESLQHALSHRASFDLLEFKAARPNYVPFDLETVDINYISRATLAARFTPVVEYTFTSGFEGWTVIPVASNFDAAPAAYSGSRGALGLANQSSNCFGIWESPEIAITPGSLYRFTATVSTNETDPNKVPPFRLRLTTRRFEIISEMSVTTTTAGSPELNPNDAGRDYFAYIHIPQDYTGDSVLLDFDLLGFDARASNKAIFLNNARLDRQDDSLIR